MVITSFIHHDVTFTWPNQEHLNKSGLFECNVQKQAQNMAEHWQNFQFLTHLFTITPTVQIQSVYLFYTSLNYLQLTETTESIFWPVFHYQSREKEQSNHSPYNVTCDQNMGTINGFHGNEIDWSKDFKNMRRLTWYNNFNHWFFINPTK